MNLQSQTFCRLQVETSGNPLISVVMIFLNAENFIEEAIESVFDQSYKNWELLLVDDGSSDRSTAIARDYACCDSKTVRYFEHPDHQNLGMSASRNLGIRHAHGEFVGFLDADDVWLPHKLERQLAVLKAYPEAAMVYSPVQWWYSWTGDCQDRRRDFLASANLPTDTLVHPPKMLVALLQQAGVSTTSSLVRREIIERVGGFEESFRDLYEDQAFSAKVYIRAPVFVSSECTYKWRKHSHSSCARAVSAGQYDQARLTFLRWLQKHLEENGISNREIRKVLRKELWVYESPGIHRLFAYADRGAALLKKLLREIARWTLPAAAQRWLRARWNGAGYCPPVGWVEFGSLRRLSPISRVYGFDRGLPVDRYYIEQFLFRHASDIRGRVLEIGDDHYTRKFGGDRVAQSDVLHVQASPEATIVADLTSADDIPPDAFDCIICTQTLMFIYDVRAAIRTLHRVLKPGGVLLVTMAGVSHQISREDMNRWGDYWRFTSLAARRAFEEFFPAATLAVEARGNVLAAIAFLHGVATEELSKEELDATDQDYEVLVTVRAQKPRTSDTLSRSCPCSFSG